MHRILAVSVVLVTTLIIPQQPAKAQQGDRRCFPETGHCIEGRFHEFWEQNGGLPVFGYPITRPERQVTSDGIFLSQYFERNRFELHPETAAPYDVLLGRLGAEPLTQLNPAGQTFPNGVQTADCLWFIETLHSVCEPFKRFWESHGLLDPGSDTYQRSLALFGLPLSEAIIETNSSGDTVRTQWFERARFEDHGEQGVLLGLLGNEVQQQERSSSPSVPDQQTLTFLPVEDTFVHQYHQESNFGTYPQLIVDANPHRESYLKFELNGLSGSISGAKLRVYVVEAPHAYSPVGGSIARMNDTNWVETQVTYNTRPTIDGPILSTLGPVRMAQWHEFDVTSAVTGNGTLSLGIKSNNANGALYASREVATFAPQLIVTVVR